MKAFKYLLPITFFVLAFLSFQLSGIFAYLPLLFGFGVMPILELILQPSIANHQDAEEISLKEDKVYDTILYFFGFLQIAFLIYFFYIIKTQNADTATIIGRVTSMGVLCGLFGINLSHELGHRKEIFSQRLAKICLSTSLYCHFFIEHNKGHHKNFSTPHDPATARYNENIYVFYIRAIVGVYKGAWHIANEECNKKHGKIIDYRNEMIQVHLLQAVFIIAALWMGSQVLLCFFGAALIGMLLMESVDYIQHYGLNREATSATTFERGMPHHSWDSHYPIGRLMLFELTRHSDHHYLANRKFQILRSHESAPQMPTGYPGTIILALLPPLWFKVMNKKIIQSI
jgi:alkane 1-monooxygenase